MSGVDLSNAPTVVDTHRTSQATKRNSSRHGAGREEAVTITKPWAVYYNVYMLVVCMIVSVNCILVLYSEWHYYFNSYKPEFNYCNQFSINSTVCATEPIPGRCEERKKGDDICGPSDPLYADQYVIVRMFTAFVLIHIAKIIFTLTQCYFTFRSEHPGTVNSLAMIFLLPRYFTHLHHEPQLDFHLVFCYFLDLCSDVIVSVVLAYYYQPYVGSHLSNAIFVLSALIVIPVIAHVVAFRGTCYCEYDIQASLPPDDRDENHEVTGSGEPGQSPTNSTPEQLQLR